MAEGGGGGRASSGVHHPPPGVYSTHYSFFSLDAPFQVSLR